MIVALRNYAVVGFGFALAILLVISAGTYHVTHQLIKAHEWVAHTLKVDQTIATAFSNLMEIQGASRGYIITGDPQFVEARNAAVRHVNESLQELQKLTADNPAQLAHAARLELVVTERLSRGEEVIALRRDQGFEAAAARMKQLLAAGGLTEVRSLIAAMQHEEDTLLQQRTADMKKTASLTIGGWAVGSGVSAAILLIVFLLLRRENIDRQQTEKRFKGLLESAPDASVIANEHGRIVLVNSQTEKSFGYPRAELLGAPFEILIPARDRGQFPRYQPGNGSGPHLTLAGAGLELHGQRKDGSEFPIEVSLSPLVNEDGWLVFNSVRDISERKQVELERDLFFNLSLDLMCIAGFDGVFKRLNPVWETTLGWTTQELLSQPFIGFVHPDDRAATIAKSAEIRQGGRAIHFENRYRCQDGSHRWLSWTAVPFAELERVFCVARDVTEQKQTQFEIEQLNRDLQAKTVQLESANKEMEAFSYSVSHDLRAPLRGIDGFTRVLQEDYAAQLDDTGREHMTRVRAATQRMGALIDDMLKLSRISRAELRREPVDLSTLAQSVVDELRRSDPNRQVNFKIAPDLRVTGDSHLLQVALENLIGNSWKFTSKKTFAHIEFGSQHAADGTLAYYIADDGAGFDSAYAGKLFNPFQRLHSAAEFPGTGVGLASVQRIIRRHGGRVWAESVVEQGAHFYFTLAKEIG